MTPVKSYSAFLVLLRVAVFEPFTGFFLMWYRDILNLILTSVKIFTRLGLGPGLEI